MSDPTKNVAPAAATGGGRVAQSASLTAIAAGAAARTEKETRTRIEKETETKEGTKTKSGHQKKKVGACFPQLELCHVCHVTS